MSMPFEIDGALIEKLSDTQLRELLRRIGAAELRRAGRHSHAFRRRESRTAKPPA